MIYVGLGLGLLLHNAPSLPASHFRTRYAFRRTRTLQDHDKGIPLVTRNQTSTTSPSVRWHCILSTRRSFANKTRRDYTPAPWI